MALGSIGLALCLLELLAHLLPMPYPLAQNQFYACHTGLGWTGQPGYEGVIEGPHFRQAVSFNSLGMHDTEHPLEKPAETFRILMLGDSYVHAVQVPETATAHQRLEENLAQEAPPNVEVISGGVINWGTNQQLLFYRSQGRRFQPDLVLLLFFIGNDFLDNLPGNVMTVRGRNCYAPYFTLCEGRLQPDPLRYAPGLRHRSEACAPVRRSLFEGMGWLYQHSRLYQQLEPLLIQYQPRPVFGRAYPSSFSALYLEPEEAELERAWQVTLATIAQLRREVEADGSRFALAIVSPAIVVQLAALTPAEQARFLADNPAFAQAQADRPNQRLAGFLANEKIPFIDLTGPMSQHLAANHLPLYIVGEGHWTAEGNRVVADLLAEWLRENRLIAP